MAKLRFQYGLHLLCAFVCLALFRAASASEYRGQVVFSGFPVPGASVTVTQGAKRLTAITDLSGMYTLADLSYGMWKVEMQCFTTIHADVSITPNIPIAKWELTLLPLDQLVARTRIAQPPPHLPPALSTTNASNSQNISPASSRGNAGEVQRQHHKGKVCHLSCQCKACSLQQTLHPPSATLRQCQNRPVPP
jgi:hypothetical protein